MVSAAQQPAGQACRGQAPRVVVTLGKPDRDGQLYQVESPDRVLRMLTLLTEAAEEFRLATMPPDSLARVRRLLGAVYAEIEQSVSPALAAELHHLLGPGPAEPDGAELRIEYTALLGWVSGLAIGMLTQLEAARIDLNMADSPLAAIQAGSGRATGT